MILVLGGTGTTGRRIARRLPDARVASRATGFDLDDPATWGAALDGVTAAYLLSPSLRPHLPRFVEEAAASGVRRLVLLSAPAAGRSDHPLFTAERAVRESGAAWTVLRPNWFAQNFSETFWRPAILAGTLSLPTGDGRTPFVDAEDIADVAASALTSDRHDGRTYELTGPRALSFAEAVALIGGALGREIRYVDADPSEHVRRQIEAGVPPETARLLTGVLLTIRDGEAATVADGVERALGRPARSFEDFVAAWAVSG